ncbi:hypothetical protein HDV03_000123 [Kappamyces sp. JEL0829]|nr:hypothetical protein HDV03_000123 [Kappamyces sp. JEL0829]
MFSDPRKKRINLGGATNTPSKQELLERSRREREARQNRELQEKCAWTIAKALKAWAMQRAATKCIISDFLQGEGRLVRVRNKTDLLALVCLVLRGRLQDQVPGLGWSDFAPYNWEHQDRLSFLLPRLVALTSTPGLGSTPLAFDGSTVFDTVESIRQAHLAPIPLRRLLACFAGPAVMNALSSDFQQALRTGSQTGADAAAVTMLGIIRLAATTGPVDHSGIVTGILSQPLCFEKMSAATASQFMEKYPFANMLLAFGSISLHQLTKKERLNVFSNFMELSAHRIKDLDCNAFIKYVGVLTGFVQYIPLPRPPSGADDSDDDMDVDSVVEQPEYQHLRRLYDTELIVQVVRAGSKDVPMACTFLVGVMSRFPGKSLEIASVIMYQYDKSFLASALAFYLDSALARELQLDPIYALGNAVHVQEWHVLVIVCEFYSRMLLTVSDEEFYDNSTTPLDALRSLSATIKPLTFHLYWSFPLSIASPLLETAYIQGLFSKFLSQIHTRDSRKRFCPANHWLVDNVDMTAAMKLVSRTEQENERVSDRVRACRQILENIPFIVAFEDRVKLFRSYLVDDGTASVWVAPSFRVEVRREQVFQDGYAQLNSLGPKLREKISITFIDSHGFPEAGIDGGGVFKEFLTECLKQAFDPKLGLFVSTPGHLLYPSPSEYASGESQLNLFEFLGRIIGRKSYLDDLPSLDPELYHGLLFLKNYSGNVEDLCLSFSLTMQTDGETKSIDLIPNGSAIPVTKANRMQYIYLVVNHKLNVQIAKPCRHFFRGLSDLIRPEWLSMFSESELQVLLGGEATSINVQEMQTHVVYDDVYDRDHPTIKLFWKVVESMVNQDRALLVKFITSCSRPPLLGFGELNPPICIRYAGPDQERLPTASTCVNLLKLPGYKDEAVLRDKLEYAIRSRSGFELS